MSGGSLQRGGDEGGAEAAQHDARAEKRAQFQRPRSRRGLYLALTAVALAVVAGVVVYVVVGRNDSGAATVAAQNGKVVLTAAQFQDHTARFYAYDAATGTRVKFFVVADEGGTIHVALDACEVCYPKKLGYTRGGRLHAVQQLRQEVPYRTSRHRDRRLQSGACHEHGGGRQRRHTGGQPRGRDQVLPVRPAG